MWRVTYEPGEVKVVARKDGRDLREQVIRTAGAPYEIRLTPDRNEMDADGKSLIFVTVEVVDKDGNLCPHAENQIFLELEGAATIAGVDNGCQTSLERFKANNRKVFNGKCLVVLKAAKNPGAIKLTAKGIDLKKDIINIQCK